MATSSSKTEIKTSYVGGHALYGRRQIFTSEVEITAENVASVINEAFTVHQTNRREIKFLYDYYRGNQPIVDRQEGARAGIMNNIVVNHANEIVSFKVGYRCGTPIEYTAIKSDEGIPEKIELLNKFMKYENKNSKDISTAEWQEVCGTAYYMCLPDDTVSMFDDEEGTKTAVEEDDAPFELFSLNPMSTFVIYSNRVGNKPLAGVTYWRGGEWTGEEKAGSGMSDYVFAIYTPTEYFEIKDSQVSKQEVNPLGMIPIVEFPNNSTRQGSFEIVIDLLDALSKTESCRLDGLEGFVESFIKFVNCDISSDDYDEFLAKGAIKVFSHEGKNADVDLISKELSQQQSQALVDDLYENVLMICGMPNRNGGLSTSDTGNAVYMRDGWSAAETKCKYSTTLWEQSEREMLKVVCKIMADKNFADLMVSDIEINFPRSLNNDLLTKVQALCEMLGSTWVHPKDAYAHSGLFTDPETASANGIKWHEELESKYEVDNVGDEDKYVPGSGQTATSDTE